MQSYKKDCQQSPEFSFDLSSPPPDTQKGLSLLSKYSAWTLFWPFLGTDLINTAFVPHWRITLTIRRPEKVKWVSENIWLLCVPGCFRKCHFNPVSWSDGCRVRSVSACSCSVCTAVLLDWTDLTRIPVMRSSLCLIVLDLNNVQSVALKSGIWDFSLFCFSFVERGGK